MHKLILFSSGAAKGLGALGFIFFLVKILFTKKHVVKMATKAIKNKAKDTIEDKIKDGLTQKKKDDQ